MALLLKLMTRNLLLPLTLAATLVAGSVASAQTTKPATRPAAEQRRSNLQGQGGRYLRQVIELVQGLDLTEDQQVELRGKVKDLQADLKNINDTHGDDRRARTKAARERFVRFRTDLGDILTPNQQKALQAKMQAARKQGDRRDPNRRQNMPEGNEAKMPENVRGSGGFGDKAASVDEAPMPSRFADRLRGGVMKPLPADMALLTGTGNDVTLGDLLAEHRPTIFVLGSWSAPSFRDRVADLPWLIDQLRDSTDRQADLVVVYTRERHPDGGVARNEEENISIPQHASADDRVAAARVVRERLPTNRPGVTVVLDTMDDVLLEHIADGQAGDFAIVVKPDGTIVARQRWFDPTAIPALVDQANTETE